MLTVSLETDCIHVNRAAAIGALAELVQKGHRSTIDSLMTVLVNDGDVSFVRKSAVEALSHIASRGDDKVINAITKLSQVQEGVPKELRDAAICALEARPTKILPSGSAHRNCITDTDIGSPRDVHVRVPTEKVALTAALTGLRIS